MSDYIKDFLTVVAYTAIVAICAIGIFVCMTDSQLPQEQYQIDTANEQQMHDLGMPTKADIEMYLEVGRWGYSTDNVMHTEHVYTALPGKKEAWCELYGIEVE